MADDYQWYGDNFESLQQLTAGSVVLESDGRTLGVQTATGAYKQADLGDYVRLYSDGGVGLKRASKDDKAKAQAQYDLRHHAPPKPAQVPNDHSQARTIRSLIDELENRIGAVERVRGTHYGPLRVLRQDLREHRNAMEGHPALDDDRK